MLLVKLVALLKLGKNATKQSVDLLHNGLNEVLKGEGKSFALVDFLNNLGKELTFSPKELFVIRAPAALVHAVLALATF